MGRLTSESALRVLHVAEVLWKVCSSQSVAAQLKVGERTYRVEVLDEQDDLAVLVRGAALLEVAEQLASQVASRRERTYIEWENGQRG